MKSFLKNLFGKAKETIDHAGEDLKEVVDAVSEDTSKLVAEAKEKFVEVKKEMKEEFTEHVGEPSELMDKAKKSFAGATEKIKMAAKEEWDSAKGKYEELKDSLSEDEKPAQDSDLDPGKDEQKEG
jgi:hypothetical protein